MVTEARYGRMRLGRCVETDYGYLGCQADVLQHLDHACSGRKTCALRIPDTELDRTNHSCPNEFKTYLNVSYKCIPGLCAVTYCNLSDVNKRYLNVSYKCIPGLCAVTYQKL